jgi:glycerophosphoryl diester phosphodiesterase
MGEMRMGIVTLTLMASCASSGRANDTTERRPIEVQGHRGARARFPENTLSAFEFAIEAGVDTLELDTGITVDRRVVISHDSQINSKLCLGPGGASLHSEPLIKNLTLAQVKEFDCGTLKNRNFPNQEPVPSHKDKTIPLLSELFELVKNSKNPHAKNIKFNIETKIDPFHPGDTVGVEEFTTLVLDEIKTYGMQERVTLQSFDFRTLDYAKKLGSAIPRSLLYDRRANFLNDATKYDAAIVSPAADLVNVAMLKDLQPKNIKVIPWTVNDEKGWADLVDLGVDGIISDDPGELIKYLKARGLRK